MRFQFTIIALMVALVALTVAHEILVEVEYKQSDVYVRIDDQLTVRDLAMKACSDHSVVYEEGITKIGAHFGHNYKMDKQIAASGIKDMSRVHLRTRGFINDVWEHVKHH